MGSLLKPQIVRYLNADGKQVPKGTPGSRKVKEKARRWYGQFIDADGKRRRVPLATDKAAARKMLADLECDVQRSHAGFPVNLVKARKASIETHIAAYEDHLRGKGVCAEHLKETVRRLRLVLEYGDVHSLGDVRPEVVDRFLAFKASENVGVSMRNAYLSSAKAFCRWAVACKRLAADPLACLKRSKGELRRRRRALTDDELSRLLEAARNRPLREICTVRSGKNKGEILHFAGRPAVREKAKRLGWERALTWKTLVLTGLRRNELRALEVRHLVLIGRRPCLMLPGSATKNKEATDLPLRADLAADLAEWIKVTGKASTDRVFAISANLFQILRRDLALAGIPYKDDQGRTIDVHALRHTTASHMARAKVTPRVAQQFMRHAKIELTLQTYTDLGLLDEREALDALPDLRLTRPESKFQGKEGKATG
jgi:integrase